MTTFYNNILRGRRRLSAAVWMLALCVLAVLGAGTVSAQAPPNDNCSNAIDIPFTLTNYGIGSVNGTEVEILNGTVQGGEFIHLDHVNRDKTVWYKFYLPTTRQVRILVEQNAANVPQIDPDDMGWSLYYAPGFSCLPTDPQMINPAVTRMEGYTHSCLQEGEYLIQVTASWWVQGLISVKLELSYPDALESAFDLASAPLDFGVISWIDPNVNLGQMTEEYRQGCQSMYFSEPICPTPSHHKTAWHTFTTDNHVDFYRFEISELYWNYSNPNPRIWGYQLYEGNVSQDSIPDGIAAGGSNLTAVGACRTLTQTGPNQYPGAWHLCELQPNTTYSIQLMIEEDYFGITRVNVYETGQGNSASPDANAVPPAYVHSPLPTSITLTDVMACNARMSLNPCAGVVPPEGYYDRNGLRYDLAVYQRFNLPTAANVSISTTSWNGAPGFYVRLYQGNACGSYTYYTDFTSNRNFPCLPAGDWLVQIMGATRGDYAHLGSGAHIGRDVRVYYTNSNVAAQAFGLETALNTDLINGLTPLVSGNTYNAVDDRVDCDLTLLPEGDVCGAANDRASYRIIYVDQNGILTVGGGNWWYNSYRLYRGDARDEIAHPRVGNRIQNLVDQAGCQSTYYNFKVCVTPGYYTLVTFADVGDIGQLESPWVNFQVFPPTDYTTFATAQQLPNLGGGTNSISGTATRFDCVDNAVPVNGVAPCPGYTKAVYREFCLTEPARIQFNSHHGAFMTPYWSPNVVHRIFNGRVSDGSVGSVYRDCNTGFNTGNCDYMPAGCYTIVSYGAGKTFPTPPYTSGLGDNIGDQTNISLSILTPLPEPRFNTIPTAEDVNSGVAIDWGPDVPGGHTAAYPRNFRTYTLGTEYFDCENDLAFPAGIVPCDASYNRISYRVFTLNRPSYLYIYNMNPYPYGYQSYLIQGDIRSISPPYVNAHDCIIDELRMCADAGTYTLITFANDNHIGRSITPRIYLDSLGTSNFDHPNQAYNFNNIPRDETEYRTRPGDPLGPYGRAGSFDIFFCSTGSEVSDVGDEVLCPIGKEPPPNALPSPTHPRRTVWYTYTTTGPGQVDVSVYLRSPGKSQQPPFAIYQSSDLSATYNPANLTLVAHSRTWWWCYNYQTVSYLIDPCSDPNQVRRYFVVVDHNAWQEPNINIEVGIKFSDPPGDFVLFDHYDNANVINGNPTAQNTPPYTPLVINGGTYTGYQGNLNCATRDVTDQNGCGVKTIWYKFEVGSAGKIRINYDLLTNAITTFHPYEIMLFREYVPGDPTSSGLANIPLTTIWVNGNLEFNPGTYYNWGQACVYEGTYYLMFTGCPSVRANMPNELVTPRIWHIPEPGDYCDQPLTMNISGTGSWNLNATVDCFTIGEAPGEDGSNLSCMGLPIGMKSAWYHVVTSGTGKYDYDVRLVNASSALTGDIRWRIGYGTCEAMTFSECVDDGAFITLNLKCRDAASGSFWVHALVPEAAIGNLRLEVTATPVPDEDCIPFQEKPIANFVFDATCVGVPTYFTNLSTTGLTMTYIWDFGDGASSIDQEPSHIYTSPGTFPVQLIVNNGYARDTITRFVTIQPPANTDFSIPASVLVGESFTPVNLTTGTIPDAVYEWDFCPGVGACYAVPAEHFEATAPPVVFTQEGDFEICLIVSNGNCKDTLCRMIAVRFENIFAGSPYDGYGEAVIYPNCAVNIWAGSPYDGHAASGSYPACEPNIYAGSPYDGFAEARVLGSCPVNIFAGSPYDGHSAGAVFPNCEPNIYAGSPYDGYAEARVLGSCPVNIFAGSPYDGHSAGALFANCIPNIFAGSPYDGHAAGALFANCIPNIFAGSPYDGHAAGIVLGVCTVPSRWAGGPYDGASLDRSTPECPPPPGIYAGSPYDGYAEARIYAVCIPNIFAGSPYDGHSAGALLADCEENIFAGSPYDGHAAGVLFPNCEVNIFAGSPYDGYAEARVLASCATNIFAGSPYDGHAAGAYLPSCEPNIYAGSPYDGFAEARVYGSCPVNIFAGSPYDGHSAGVYQPNCIPNIYAGSPYDGFAMATVIGPCIQNIYAGSPYDGHSASLRGGFRVVGDTVCFGEPASLWASAPTNWYSVPTGGTALATAVQTYITPALDETRVYYVDNTCGGGATRMLVMAIALPKLEANFDVAAGCLGQPSQFYNQTKVAGPMSPSFGTDILGLGTVGVPPNVGRLSFSSSYTSNFAMLYNGVQEHYQAWHGNNSTAPSTQWAQWNYLSPKAVRRFYFWNRSDNATYYNRSPQQVRLYYSDGGPWKLVKLWTPPYPSSGVFDTGVIPETYGIFASRWKVEVDVAIYGPNWGEFQVFAAEPVTGGNMEWSFDESGGTSTAQNPQFTYNVAGIKNVRLIASAPGLCPDTVNKLISYVDAQFSHYRSRINGNWTDVQTWQVLDEASNTWQDAVTFFPPGCGLVPYPTSVSKTVAVRHIVHYDQTIPVGIDEVTVQAPATLIIPDTADCILNENGPDYIDFHNWGRVNIAGNWQFLTGSRWYNYNGSTVQFFRNVNAQNMMNLSYYNLEIKNPGYKVLTGDSTVLRNNVTFMGGHIRHDDFRFKILKDATITDASHLNGYFVTNSNGSVFKESVGPGGVSPMFFPVGHSAAEYNPITIHNTGTLDSFAVRVAGTFENDGVYSTDLQGFNSINRTWHVDESSPGGSNVEMTIHWEANDENSGFDRNAMLLSHYTNANGWVPAPNPADFTYIPFNDGGTGTHPDPYRFKKAGVYEFSPYDGSSEPTEVFPVENLRLFGEWVGREAKLRWTTDKERNNAGFELQRSIDGASYQPVAFVNAIGWADQLTAYDHLDGAVASMSENRFFYRLRQVDFDGRQSYSNIVELIRGQTVEDMMVVYPNPVQNGKYLTVRLTLGEGGDYAFELYDALGKLLYVNRPTLSSGESVMEIPIEKLAKGVYQLRVTGGRMNATHKVLVND